MHYTLVCSKFQYLKNRKYDEQLMVIIVRRRDFQKIDTINYLFIFHTITLIKVILIFGRNNFQDRCYVFLDAALLRKFVRSNHVSKRAVVIFMHAYYFSYQNMIMVSEYSVLVEKVGVNGVEFHLFETESNPLLIFSIIIQMTSIMILEHLILSHTN